MNSRHQLIRADAGTGKTYALSLRYLELLAAGVEPSRIVAATFTRKAAGEILERILLRLAEAVVDPEREQVLRRELGLDASARGLPAADLPLTALLEGLVQALPAVQVSTLDSFFARVVHGFRTEMGFGDLQRVGAPTDPGFVPLRAAALVRQLEALGSDDGEDLQALTDLASRLYRGDAQRAVAGGVDLLVRELDAVYREQRSEDAWQGVALSAGARLDEEKVLALLEQIDRAAELIGHKSATRLLRKFTRQVHDGQLQEAVRSRVVQGWLAEGPSLTLHKKALPALVVQALEGVVPHVGALLLTELNERTRATREVLEGFERQFEPLLRARGAATFDQLVEQVARWLSGEVAGDPSVRAGSDALERYQIALALLYRLDARVEHLLLDEFQDTSRLQWRALVPLVEEILSWGDGSRTLFAVGDPKQAIYGWRGGCVELFDVLQGGVEGAGGELRALRSSYRSAPALVDLVNRVFAGLSGATGLDAPRARARDRWLENFGEHESARPELRGGARVLTTGRWEGEFPDDDPLAGDDEEQGPRDHIGDVARYVMELQRTAVDGSSIGVLTATNRTAGRLRDALARCGVVASGEGGARFEDDPVLLQLLSALRLAERPGDRISAFHLRGPVAALLAADVGCAAPTDLPDGRGAVAPPTEQVARRWRAAWSDLGPSRLLASWRLALLSHVSPATQRRLRQLVATARAFEDEGLRGLTEFVDYALQQSLDERNAGADVQVMTVHKAKGLEFDLVVLGELERPVGRLNNPQVEVLREEPTAAPTRIFRATNRHVRAFSSELERAHEQELERRTADDLSLLYVALTRARHQLHLLLQPVPEKGGSRQATAASVLLQTLCADLQGEWRSAYTELLRSGEVAEVALGGESQGGGQRDSGATVDGGTSVPRTSSVTDQGPSPAVPGTLRQVQQTVDPAELRRALQLRAARSALRGELFHAWLASIEWLDGHRGDLGGHGDHGDHGDIGDLGDPAEPTAEASWPLGPKQRQAAIVRLRERPSPSELARWWQQFREIVAQPQIRRLFERPPKRRGERVEVWRERAFALLDETAPTGPPAAAGSGLVRGTFDRVEVYWRGRQAVGARVIDFKTGGRPEGDEFGGDDPYRLQIGRYRSALARMLHVLETHVQGELVWLDRGEVESV